MNSSSLQMIQQIQNDLTLSNEARVVLSLLIDEPAFCRALAAPNLTLKDAAAAIGVCPSTFNTMLKQLSPKNKLLLPQEIVPGTWRISPLLILYFKVGCGSIYAPVARGRPAATAPSAAKWRNDGDGADIIGAPFRAGHCTEHTAARPDLTPPDRSDHGAQGGSRRRDSGSLAGATCTA